MRSFAKAVFQLIAGFALFIFLGYAWMFGQSAYRNRGYEEDRRQIAVGNDAGSVLTHCSHATRITATWRIGDVDPVAPGVRYPYRSGVLERPVNKLGKPVGIESCECEYLLFGFFRKFVTVQFDKDDKAAGIRDWTLD